jgi:hypothetical protein
MFSDENPLAALNVPHISTDPRHVALTAKIDALSERAGAIHDEIGRVRFDQGSAHSGDRARRIARWLADGGDPAKKPATEFDHEQQLARLQEELNAVTQAGNLLTQEQKDVERAISLEIVSRHRDTYLTLIVAIHEAEQALLRVLDDEETFAGHLVVAGVVPGTFIRVTTPEIRHSLETLRQESRRHFGLDLGRAQPPHTATPSKTHPEAMAVVAE